MNANIHIVDRGRGLQLSTSRIAVQDLVPYFQEGCGWDEIIRWIPALSREEIAVVEQYYREHKETLDAEDRRIREQNAQRKDPPEVQRLREEGKTRMQALREQLLRTKANGEPL